MSGLVARPSLARAAPWLGCYAGGVTLAAAYSYAATHAGDQLHFHLFWIGMALFFVPTTLRLCQRRVARAERLALVAAIGLFDALPKFLRSPDQLVFYDELAHYRQTEITIATGRLFQPNPLVPIARVYPGLHALTAMLADLSGLTTLQLALLLLGILHMASLIGVFALGEAIGQSARTAALAALLYSLNPGFLFFDAMYAYESLALVFFIWALVALCRADGSRHARERAGWYGVALALGVACTVTHHASSYVLLATALLMSAISAVRRAHGTERPERTRALLRFTLSLMAAILAWTIGIARSVAAYLGPLARALVVDAARLLQPHADHRTLFAGSTTPLYERLAAFASPLIAGIGACAGLALLHSSRRRHSFPALALYGLAVLYFATMPLMVTQGGNEAARRGWSFTYLGLAVLAAPALPWLAGERRIRALAAAALLVIVMVGNTAMNTNETYRFPGAVIYGSDTRTLTAEVLDTVRWFRATFGTGRLIIADRGNALAFAALGDEWNAPAWRGLPIWQLYLSARPPDASLLRSLREQGYQFLVIDERMLSTLPRIGFYIAAAEPGGGAHTRPPPAQAVARYERLPWAIKIYQTDNLEIYRLDYAALATPRPTLRPTAQPGADGASPPGPP